MMNVLPLNGYKSYSALQSFCKIMLGLKMLPSYMAEGFEEFFERIQMMPAIDQERMIREAALFVPLDKDEIDSLVCFCADKNKVPYTSENMKNLGPAEFMEAIVSVCCELVKIKIDFLTDKEKKN